MVGDAIVDLPKRRLRNAHPRAGSPKTVARPRRDARPNFPSTGHARRLGAVPSRIRDARGPRSGVASGDNNSSSEGETMMRHLLGAAALAAAGACGAAQAQDASMGFFITSQNPGEGANFGGIAGADAHCTALAEAAGTTGRTWAAYLSTSEADARDRIGAGPWTNAAGVVIAESVDALHGEGNNITKETALDETGAVVNGRGDTPNRHDILTGSLPDGTRSDMTCGDWTLAGADGAAIVGHHDRMGLDETPPSLSWNSSHPTRGGCALEALRGTGGDGLIYCFATD
jgi:hypothetical protein